MRSKQVPADLAGPVDRAIRGLFGTTWGHARAWIAAGKVRIGGVLVTEATARARADDEIVVDEAAPRRRAGELDDLDVVYWDAQVVVVAKPSGVSTVPYEGTETDTLDARVRAWLQRRRLVPAGARPTLGIVHRLDRETTGLVVFTRTWLAKQALTSQFRHHTVHRRYLAIAHGDVPSRTLRSFLVVNRGDGLRGTARGPGRARPPAESREAITHVERIEALDGATLVGCRLETGRTHQIRIHLSESGNPLVGERVYVRGHRRALIEAPRLMLHAAELGFVHPATERAMRWERPIPDDMNALLARLRHAR